MPRICDRSPCNGLMAALGRFVFGDIEDNRPQGFVLMAAVNKKRVAIEIEYCPFCGTQIQQVNDMLVEPFMRPRRRRISRKLPVRSAPPRGASKPKPLPIQEALAELKKRRRGQSPLSVP